MKRGEAAESIPFDLVLEILSRLPAKSVARFRRVSKLWCSILHRPYFTELFLTRQRARPRLLFVLESSSKEYSFYSSHQTPNSCRKSYYSRFLMKFSEDSRLAFNSCLTSGLMFFRGIYDDVDRVVCNPTTRRYAILPSTNNSPWLSHSFLGFDPIGKQFKVLFSAAPNYDIRVHDHKILTLVNGILRWRKIRCPFIHRIFSNQSVCINGVLYYSAQKEPNGDGVVCFDVRSETFKFVDKGTKLCFRKLINYKGKLGGIKWEKADELGLWFLQDVEKQEWSNDVYTLDEDTVDALKKGDTSVVGMAATGEIVFANRHTRKPFYVFYYNLERKTLQRVEIQGLGEYHNESERVTTYVDHVEDLDIIDATKKFKSNKGLKIITKRPKPHRHTPPHVKKSTIKLINQYELLTWSED